MAMIVLSFFLGNVEQDRDLLVRYNGDGDENAIRDGRTGQFQC
jgi:hypothetical protein